MVRTLEGHTGSVTSLPFFPDNNRLVSGSEDNTIRVWDLNSGQCLATLEGHTGMVMSVLVTLEGQRILSAGCTNKAVKVWDARTWECIRTLEGDSHSVRALALHPDGRRVVSGGDAGNVIISDITTGRIEQRIDVSWSVLTLAITPRVKDAAPRLLAGSRDRISVRDLETGTEVMQLLRTSSKVRKMTLIQFG